MKENKVLEEILMEIQEAKKVDRAEFFQECVSKRLNKSLQVYYNSLDCSATYLQHLNGTGRQKKVIKQLGENDAES